MRPGKFLEGKKEGRKGRRGVSTVKGIKRKT